MGAFSGMKDAKRGHASNILKEGTYVCRVDRCDHFEAKQSGEMFKVTLTVLGVVEGTAHRVGEVVNVMMARKHGTDQWLSNIKSCIAGILGCQDDQVDEGVVLKCLDSNPPGQDGYQMLQGLVTKVKAISRTSKNKDAKTGENYTYQVYTWGAAFTPEEIVAAIGAEGVAKFFPNGL